MRKLTRYLFSIPAWLLFLTIVAYGILSPWIGFYWDDWSFAWILHFLGPREFIPAFAPFRPLLGPIFMVTTSLFGEHPFTWQIFAMALRYLTGLGVWWSFSKVWPDYKCQVGLLSLCFIVFPGYQSQWVALTHSNQELISLAAYLFSFGFTALAVRQPGQRFVNTTVSLLLMFLGLFPTEYFFGLELLRPIIIFFILKATDTIKQDMVKTLRTWLPYLVLWISNSLFLIFYRRSGVYESYGVKALGIFQLELLQLIARLIEDTIKAIGIAGLQAWTAPLNLLTQPLLVISNLLTIILIGVVAGVMSIFLLRLYRDNPQDEPLTTAGVPWSVQAIILGIVGILMGRLPSWAAGLPLQLWFSRDRFLLSMMLGSSFLFIGLLDFFIKNSRRKIILVSIFIALAVGQQFSSANSFRVDWLNQRDFFWQLAWRIPAMHTDTLLLTHELPLMFESDYNLSAPLSWIYAPEQPAQKMPYMFAYTKARLGSSLLPSLHSGQDISARYRTVNFNGNTSDVIVFYHPVPGCVRILDPVYASADTVPDMTYMLTDAIPLSDLSRIITDAEQPILPAYLFGLEPAHSWCYYYQKADLARQAGDWQTVVSLGDEALEKGYAAIMPAEWLPFIEAYAAVGEFQDAVDLTVRTVEGDAALAPALCNLWQRIETEHGIHQDFVDKIDELRNAMRCYP